MKTRRLKGLFQRIIICYKALNDWAALELSTDVHRKERKKKDGIMLDVALWMQRLSSRSCSCDGYKGRQWAETAAIREAVAVLWPGQSTEILSLWLLLAFGWECLLILSWWLSQAIRHSLAVQPLLKFCIRFPWRSCLRKVCHPGEQHPLVRNTILNQQSSTQRQQQPIAYG